MSEEYSEGSCAEEREAAEWLTEADDNAGAAAETGAIDSCLLNDSSFDREDESAADRLVL